MRRLLVIVGLLTLACGRGRKDVDVESGDADVDADSDADTDTDTDLDTEGSFEVGAPLFSATFDGQTFTAEEGHWLPGSTTYVVAVNSDVEVQLVLDGNIKEEASVEVQEISWYKTVHNGYEFKYVGEGGGVSFDVLGRDSSGDFLWGELDGDIPVTDVEGTGGTISLEELTLESWKRYGAR